MATRSAAQEERRRQILDAAVRAFARKGYHACRVSDIAEEAGVAYGLVYHYFESKDAVLESIFREMWGMMVGAINAIEEIEESPREQLRKSCAIVLRTWRDYPDVVRVLVREVARSGEQLQREVEEIAHAFEALQRIIERGQQEKVFRDDLSPRLAAWIVYGSLEEILTGWVWDGFPGRTMTSGKPSGPSSASSATAFRLARRPVFARDRPALVVSPAAADLQVARRVALVAEARALDEAFRALVVRLDVRLEPVKLQAAEAVAHDELEALGHEPCPGRRRECVVPEVRALEEPARDLADVVDAGDRVVVAAAHEEAAL